MTQNFIRQENYRVEDLLRIMQMLRGEGGCPWDREQDHHTIRNNFIEETYEVVEAIDNEDAVLLREELGDVLLQVVFHSQMEQEKDVFDFDDVCDGICKKLIHRHPHVFGEVTANSSEEVLHNWEAIKREEKKQATATSTLVAVSRALPSLIRCQKVQSRAAKSGLYPSGRELAIDELKSSVSGLEEALVSNTDDGITEKLGELLFSAVNLSRILKKDPEEALYHTTDRFISRFSTVEGKVEIPSDKPEENFGGTV